MEYKDKLHHTRLPCCPTYADSFINGKIGLSTPYLTVPIPTVSKTRSLGCECVTWFDA